MRWVFENWNFPSEKNTLIKCYRVLGEWSIMVDGCGESTQYMLNLWKQAIARVPKKTPVKQILMLGLAGGACVEMLHRRFPGCHITAIEWDPVMIKIMDQIKLFRRSYRPEIILGDAAEVIPQLDKKFDLILFDLFQGPLTPEQVKKLSFFKDLQPRLNPQGFLFVNAYQQPEIIETARNCFAQEAAWKFHLNLLSLYRPFGAGVIGDPLPTGYRQFRNCQDYLQREWSGHRSIKIIGSKQIPGITNRVGPAISEKYYGDLEPPITTTGPKRLVIWQRLTNTQQPPGWFPSPFRTNAEVTGFVNLKAHPDPFSVWAPHAKRHLKHWLAQQQDWQIIEPTFDVFLAAYLKSSMSQALKDLHVDILQQKHLNHGQLLRFFAFQRRAANTIEAGFATLDVPEINQTIHIASFILDSAKATQAGTGLIYHWFQDSTRRQIQFLDFDLFKGAQDPKSWCGFSRFKGQFGTHFIRYPMPLIHSAGNWSEYFQKFFPK